MAKYYYKDGIISYNILSSKILHRIDGPAIESMDGYRAWIINNKYHREDGPAIEGRDGYKAWYMNGKSHRIDGPAIEQPKGYKQWWVNGKEYTQSEFNKHPLVVAYKANRIIRELLNV